MLQRTAKAIFPKELSCIIFLLRPLGIYPVHPGNSLTPYPEQVIHPLAPAYFTVCGIPTLAIVYSYLKMLSIFWSSVTCTSCLCSLQCPFTARIRGKSFSVLTLQQQRPIHREVFPDWPSPLQPGSLPQFTAFIAFTENSDHFMYLPSHVIAVYLLH